MSGGHFDYKQHRLRDILEEISFDQEVNIRFPKIAMVYRKLTPIIYQNIHDLDWDLSCDSSIKDDKEFEQLFIAKLLYTIGEIHGKGTDHYPVYDQ
jgi:hypothetical protein